tara:strand:- start:2902 stop:4596 length:1695 start_codon:yes stop_codon:yes gene_type:complete
VVRLIKVQKGLDRWFKEKWVDVSRKDKDGKHPPCGRSKAKTSSKGYPKCRPSVRVSSKTPKTAGEMTSGQKSAATKRKRSKRQGVKGKPTVVKGEPMGLAWRLLKGPQFVLQDAHLPAKPFPDLPEGIPPQNVAMFQEHYRGEEGGAPPEGFHEKYNLHPDAKVSMYGIGRNASQGWKPGTDQLKYIDDMYANQFNYKLPNISPDATHVIANTGHSYPIGAALPQGSNIIDVQQQQEGFPANQARWDRQQPSYEAIQQSMQPEMIQQGEPMDLAWRLLKTPDDFDEMQDYFGEMQDELERSKAERSRSFPKGRKRQRSMGEGSVEEEREPGGRRSARNRGPSPEDIEAFYDSLEFHPGSRGHEINTLRSEASRSYPLRFGTFMPLDDSEYVWEESAEDILPEDPDLWPDDRMHNVALQRETLSEVPTFAHTPFNPLTGFTRSEPMDLSWRLLKDRKSPEAFRHKKEYDTKYESSPSRHKYRAELARERRKKGVMGHGGADMSHTQQHTIVPEDPHSNRARHFKERGTLKAEEPIERETLREVKALRRDVKKVIPPRHTPQKKDS